MNYNFGNNYAFRHANEQSNSGNIEGVSTRQGIGIKTSILLFITFISSVVMMVNVYRFNDFGLGIFVISSIINTILQLIICFVPSTTKALSIPYAISEGIVIGAMVGIIELLLPGVGYSIALLSLVMTVAIFLAAAILYATGIIKVTNKFRTYMFVTLSGILLGSLVLAIISVFNYEVIAILFSETICIVVGIVFVFIAGLYVTISLDNANKIVEANISKDYEWYAAYGILINVIWLFLEVFRLLLRIAAANRD